MYQAGLSSILGLRPRGQTFAIDPCISSSWPSYRIIWQYRATRYEITVSNPLRRCRGVAAAELDGAVVDATTIPLVDDGAVHRVVVTLGKETPSPAGARRPAMVAAATLA
jgi:cyclic beta-1,2-glucan synthetase